MSGLEFIHDENVRSLHEACTTIEDAGGCDGCPLKGGCCLNEESFMYICEELTAGMIEELLSFADDIEQHENEEDAVAYFADLKRKMDIEERGIDERWGY